jgi:microcin C transport system permease protein
MDAPWMVTSTFAVMVLVLTLIAFVGEAVREASDPKKFSTYQ